MSNTSNNPTRDLRVLSLGAGVQSSTVLLMMKAKEIEPADIAIFADTQWEPKAVYDWLEYLETVSSVPIVRVTAGNIRADALNADKRFMSMPVFIRNPDGGTGRGRRQCTREYKITPVEQAIRRHMEVKTLAGKQVEMVFGISFDEMQRMRDPRHLWQRNIYPLVDLRMTRWDCQNWMHNSGFPQPPRSACIGCPYRRNEEWRSLSGNEFADAVNFDARLRTNIAISEDREDVSLSAYLHRELIPLGQVDLRSEEERGQMSMFDAECEGMCGV